MTPTPTPTPIPIPTSTSTSTSTSAPIPTLTDSGGYPLTGATADGRDAWEKACAELRCLIDDPVASVDAAIALAPAMPMAPILRAWLFLLGTEPDGVAEAAASIALAAPLVATERERLHLMALSALVDGHWHRAAAGLEALTIRYPRDALALQAGHQLDFFTGNARMLRDRIARALPFWDSGRPGYHALLGMQAFGLEESGDYVGAERSGRAAIELEPRDGWAWHAVAHVHEMRNDADAGRRWLGDHEAIWAPGSFLAVHNQWHLALCLLEGGDHAAVLAHYDRAIGGPGSTLALDLVDASALLWRLQLRGVDVGERWLAVAERWAPMASAAHYAFNDLHATLAFVGAGQPERQRDVITAQQRLIAAHPGDDDAPDNRRFTAEVGAPATRAIIAFGDGDYRAAIDGLMPLRPIAHRFGGSHAQRDLLDLTLIEAAARLGDDALVTALANERAAVRPRDWTVARLRATDRRPAKAGFESSEAASSEAASSQAASGQASSSEAASNDPASTD